MDGSLVFLYYEIRDSGNEDIWRAVIQRKWLELKKIRDFYLTLKRRPCLQWPEISNEESCDLYSASRISDIMLLPFQKELRDVSNFLKPQLTLDNYREFFNYIGFSEKNITKFHPFYCEVTEIFPTNDEEIRLIDVKWPALMLGNMLFSRAGVTVSAPEHLLTAGVADTSILYWSFLRRYRKTEDLSVGCGPNSQWGTEFRRDFDLGDSYVYNVDGHRNLAELNFPIGEDVGSWFDDGMSWMSQQERVNFLKYRCHTVKGINSSALHPYNDFWEEIILP